MWYVTLFLFFCNCIDDCMASFLSCHMMCQVSMFIWSVFVGYSLELILHSVGPKKEEKLGLWVLVYLICVFFVAGLYV